MNCVHVSGYATREPSLRTGLSGKSSLTVPFAVHDRVLTSSGWADKVVFLDIVLLGEYALAMRRHITKGTGLAVEGRLEESSWIDSRTGERQKEIRIVATRAELLGKPEKRRAEGGPARAERVDKAIAEAERSCRIESEEAGEA